MRHPSNHVGRFVILLACPNEPAAVHKGVSKLSVTVTTWLHTLDRTSHGVLKHPWPTPHDGGFRVLRTQARKSISRGQTCLDTVTLAKQFCHGFTHETSKRAQQASPHVKFAHIRLQSHFAKTTFHFASEPQNRSQD